MSPSGGTGALAGHEMNMPVYKFRVGQAVEFFPEPGVDRSSRGRYTIVRLFPLDGENMPQYRIKSSSDGHERLARESQLGTR